MLKTEDIICISSIDWDFLWQGHQEIMTRLARNGNRVLFMENTGARVPNIRDVERIKKRIANWRKGLHGIRKIEDGLYVYSPLVLPFPYLRIARFINKRIIFSVLFRWLKTVGFSEPIVWVFLPTGLSLDLINEIEPKVLIDYCIDSFQASSRDARKIKRTEKAILKKADLVFVTSDELFRYCAQYNSKVHYFPFGVNIESFKRVFHSQHTTPDDIKRVKRPIAGYIGGIHKWIDFDLVQHVASKNADVSFVFCGPIQTDITRLKGLPNVIFLGQKEPEELPKYIKEFDIAIIPYRITEYTRNVYPTKLNEYLSMGKCVVSADLPEIRKFNDENNGIVRIADTKDAFANRVRQAIDRPFEKNDVSFAMDVAEKNSWSNKVERMSSLIERMEHEKAQQRERLWKGYLTRLYKKTRKRLVPAIVVLVLLYMVLFHTPLIWFLGNPLLIKDVPGKADVIVALGGGVGESGKVGQGYEERVDLAVRLYKGEFAKIILYSSGYRYIMKEAQVMKALSVAMGVDAKDIILDDTPVTTYDMIVHLKGLAVKNNWEKIMLVSSPYHMLRVNLLCKKHLRDAKVFYVPVEESSYYGKRNSNIKLRHIRGILHEYLAILYYRLKNYI